MGNRIKVYQIKMKTEKMIPISLVLYQIMKIYIKKHHIKPTDFLFKSKDGGAYRTGTFVKGFKANCKKYGIHISGETFQSGRKSSCNWNYSKETG